MVLQRGGGPGFLEVPVVPAVCSWRVQPTSHLLRFLSTEKAPALLSNIAGSLEGHLL